jgi:D-xylose transport system substrate-binding protein
MTVYKPIRLLAYKAAEVAVKLARKEPLGETTRGIGNGKIDVPSILLTPVAVDRDNLASTVIADGYQKREDVYRDVPRDLWPKKP